MSESILWYATRGAGCDHVPGADKYLALPQRLFGTAVDVNPSTSAAGARRQLVHADERAKGAHGGG